MFEWNLLREPRKTPIGSDEHIMGHLWRLLCGHVGAHDIQHMLPMPGDQLGEPVALAMQNPFDNLRIMGVLQRIALCYGIASLMIYFLSKRTVWRRCIPENALVWHGSLRRAGIVGIADRDRKICAQNSKRQDATWTVDMLNT